MPDESARVPPQETVPSLLHKAIGRVRELHGYGELGDELASKIADKLISRSYEVNDSEEHWINKVVWSQEMDLYRKQGRHKKLGGRPIKPLTQTKTNRDGKKVEVER